MRTNAIPCIATAIAIGFISPALAENSVTAAEAGGAVPSTHTVDLRPAAASGATAEARTAPFDGSTEEAEDRRRELVYGKDQKAGNATIHLNRAADTASGDRVNEERGAARERDAFIN